MLSLSKLTAPYYSLLRVICYTLQATLIACLRLPLPHCYFLHIIPPSNKEHTFLAALCVQNYFFFICPPLFLLIHEIQKNTLSIFGNELGATNKLGCA